jgi:2-dehydro-3-deoxyphosphogluconate aldolase/(4S)-4-hydroxy-2-oxoglutarate aldolase
MARFTRLEVLNRLAELGFVPVWCHADAEVACQVATSCATAGMTMFEFTNRDDRAIEVFRALAQHCQTQLDEVILGVGSIVDEPTAALFVAHGANFVVGPYFNDDVARFCNRRKIAYIPGCMTPAEITTAETAGVEVVKYFPAQVGGPDFVKAILGPCPWTTIMATGLPALDRASVAEWFKAGVVALGAGSQLIKKEHVDRGDFAAISARAQEVLGWVREARSS